MITFKDMTKEYTGKGFWEKLTSICKDEEKENLKAERDRYKALYRTKHGILADKYLEAKRRIEFAKQFCVTYMDNDEVRLIYENILRILEGK